MKRLKSWWHYKISVSDPPIITLEGLYPLLLLGLLSLLAFLFHMIRIQFNEAVDFSLDWNLFLSWIPLLIAYITSILSKRFGPIPILVGILSVVWLAFFPNAPYMITDLVHLTVDFERNLTWHDIIMLFYYAQVSLINGLVSLYWIHRTWQRTYGKTAGLTLLLISLPLAGFGVYLGRIRRWNSWDILHDPIELLKNILASALDRTAVLLSFEFALMLGMLYLVLWLLLRFRIRNVRR
ncbi:hypothetical protein GCM10027275_48320 [Rhabdobacter roseus]|uniref:Putative membrane protein n=1 Tax=Rhabdobacter roseus TaxID=1655419 RepID=A0A840TVG7_9BACT|nr:DUF1361 domain-containing protein [Rhabdobacter roseus]MBB5286895.1 putative membrane protein [Rhabdobacter roseus]